MSGKFFGSVKWITTPPMIIANTVMDAMTPAARPTVSGFRKRNVTARTRADDDSPALSPGVS
jgi:hypothetical protein